VQGSDHDSVDVSVDVSVDIGGSVKFEL
jgi:hypothetical protein